MRNEATVTVADTRARKRVTLRLKTEQSEADVVAACAEYLHNKSIAWLKSDDAD